MRFPRMTTRRLMVLVALVAAALALLERWHRFRGLADFYDRGFLYGSVLVLPVSTSRPSQPSPILRGPRAGTPLEAWCSEVAAKYRWAARHPWLPVAPDTPPPMWPSGRAPSYAR